MGKRFLNEAGESMVMVMVAIGMLGAASLFFVDLAKQNSLATKTAAAKADLEALHASVLTTIKDAKSCNMTFNGKSLQEGEMFKLVKATSQGKADLNQGFSTDNGKIKLVGIKLFDPTGPLPDKAPRISEQPSYSGRQVVVGFYYENNKVNEGEKIKIQGPTEMVRYALLTLNNYKLVGEGKLFFYDKSSCERGANRVADDGFALDLASEDKAQYQVKTFYNCYDTKITNPVDHCVI